jgi:hypothetical protein
MNFIRSHGLHRRQFQTFFFFFWSEIDAGYGGFLYHTEVRRLSHGTMLKPFFFLALRLEVEMFMIEKDNTVAELSDEKWLLNLALLCDISHNLNDLNTKLQV